MLHHALVPPAPGAVPLFHPRPVADAGNVLLRALLLAVPPVNAQRDPSGIFDFLHADGNGVLTRTEVRRTGLQTPFHVIDSDGDCTISRAEFVRGAGEHG